MTEYVRTQHCQTRLPVEPRDAKRIMRKIEESYQIVIERPGRLSHNSLV